MKIKTGFEKNSRIGASEKNSLRSHIKMMQKSYNNGHSLFCAWNKQAFGHASLVTSPVRQEVMFSVCLSGERGVPRQDQGNPLPPPKAGKGIPRT